MGIATYPCGKCSGNSSLNFRGTKEQATTLRVITITQLPTQIAYNGFKAL